MIRFTRRREGEGKREGKKNNKHDLKLLKIDFSLKREVFYVVIGSLLGAITMEIPKLIYDTLNDVPYYLIWVVFGHVIGVFSPLAAVAGITIHIITATSIGIVTGIFLYKTNILNISKPLNGLLYGIFTGSIIFVVWYIPINEFILMPENVRTIANIDPLMSEEEVQKKLEYTGLDIIINAFVMHLTFGITLGIISSLLSIRFGTRYRCPFCSISFSRVDLIKQHLNQIHGEKPIDQKRILILGGGFGGVETLRELQNTFRNDIRIDITLISKDNFFLFTPMLHEVSSGMIETRHVAVPLRSICKRARFIEADISNIDLNNRNVKVTNQLFKNLTKMGYSNTLSSASRDRYLENQNQLNQNTTYTSNNNDYVDNNDYKYNTLEYDYLVLALGSKTNFFGNSRIESRSFTMKNLYDAFLIRSHIISTLEQADSLLSKIENESRMTKGELANEKNPNNKDEIYNHNEDILLKNLKQLQKSLTTYVVVGGGFAGVESVGELNDFIRESIKEYYHNINLDDIKVILVSSGSSILPEMNKEIGKFALEKLRENNVQAILNNRVIDVKGIENNSEDTNEKINSKIIILKDGTEIQSNTLIWTAGVLPEQVVHDLACEHDKKGSIITDEYLRVKEYSNVFAIGDCASTIDPNTGNPYPPTAQHAKRQGKTVAKNIILSIEDDFKANNNENKKVTKENNNRNYNLVKFSYQTRGIMATIGKRNGVAMILGHSIKGITAWWLWRLFYLSNLPNFENKVRVIIDWTVDILFGRNITRLKSPVEIKDIVVSSDNIKQENKFKK